jgi:DNA-binding transcriptional MerR regulator
MRVESKACLDTIDEEWITLLKTAKNLGISLQEIRDFLNQHKQQPVDEDFETLWG